MKTVIILLILLVAHLAWAEDIYLTPGSSQTLSVRGKIKVKGRKSIRISERGDQIKITGDAVGMTTIQSANQSYTVYVVSADHLIFLKSLHLLLITFLDLHAEFDSGVIVVKGQLHRLSDWQAIVEKAQEHESQFLMQARIDKDIHLETKKWISQSLHAANLSIPDLTWDHGVTAHLADDQKILDSKWQTELSKLGLAIVYEKSQLSVKPLVRVKIIVAEVNKKIETQFGIDWPEMISAQIAPTFKGFGNIEVFMKAMEQKGLGQILASPNLLARSGSEAEFLAGGEFAIKVVSRQNREVIWKKHGIYLKIKPQADVSGKLSIELTTEVSMIDASQTVDGVPGLKTNRMSTHFDLSQARTIVLSGLIKNDWGKSESGVLGLSKLPILGGLFRSENFYDNKSELVIFVTPEIVREHENSDEKINWPKGWSADESAH